MTPKEKAKELREKCDGYTCYAEVVVDEILNLEPPELAYMEPFSKSWWQEVKAEIEKL